MAGKYWSKVKNGVSKKTIYLSAPISGLTASEAFLRFDMMKMDLKGWYTILNPLTGKDYLRALGDEILAATNVAGPLSADHPIFNRDHWMVTQADVVLVDLTGAKKVSIGCMFEMAWASHLDKHVILIMDAGNVHQHSFVKQAAHVVFSDYMDAMLYARELA